jgi:hypothetical protein
MNKKRFIENSDEEIEKTEDIIIEEDINNETEKIEETINSDPNFGRIPFKVHRNYGKELVLVDNKGNGIRIPTPEKYKDIKTGDTVYL